MSGGKTGAPAPINWGWVLANALAEEARQEAIREGIRAMVAAYYEDYTDAESLDEFLYVLLALGKHFHGLDEDDVAACIRTAEAAYRADTGRPVRSLEDEEDE